MINKVEVVSIFGGSIYEDTCYISEWGNKTTRPTIFKQPTHQRKLLTKKRRDQKCGPISDSATHPESIDENTFKRSGNKLKHETPPRTPPRNLIFKKPNAKQIFR